MADTCGECEFFGCGGTGGYAKRDGKSVYVQQCKAGEPDFTYGAKFGGFIAYVYADNGACPAFKRKADAAERAARRIAVMEEGDNWAVPALARIIREEYAKDKEAVK